MLLVISYYMHLGLLFTARIVVLPLVLLLDFTRTGEFTTIKALVEWVTLKNLITKLRGKYVKLTYSPIPRG